MTHPVPVTIFADFACPFSYVAEVALRQREAEGEIVVRQLAYELHPALALLPSPTAPAAWEAALVPFTEPLGLKLRSPGFVPRTRKAHEAAHFARSQGAEPRLRPAIYSAYWEAGQDIGRIDVLVALGEAAGLPATEMKIALDIDLYADAVAAEAVAARRLGITETPTLGIGTGESTAWLVGLPSAAQLDEALSRAHKMNS